MKKLYCLMLGLFLIAGFATIASADFVFTIYADSTLAGQSGFLLREIDEEYSNTFFVFPENGHTRVFATRDGDEQTWTILPAPSIYIAPATGDGIGASWTTFPDDFDRPSTATLEAFESITVPVGNITSSARCVVHPDVDPDETTEIRHWSEGIGLVSDFFPGDGADVLASYTILGGSGYFPLAVGNSWEYEFEDVLTPVGDGPIAVNLLYPCVPNPFNPVTNISFEMATSGNARLSVYDAAGRLVRTLVNEQRAAGRHTETWDGRDDTGRSAAAGVYLYRFEAGEVVQTRTMTLVK